MPPRLVLVNPVNQARAGPSANRNTRFSPLGLGMVAALTPDTWHVELVDENWAPFAYRPADLVGITAFTPSANRAYAIAAQYRARGVPVVMGGIHASLCSEEALRFVDTVVIGEAESVWPRVLADWEAGRLRKVYRGALAQLAGLPAPRRDLFHPGYTFATVQTSRGCPMDCDFCSVTAFNGRRYRRRPPQEVLDELGAIAQRRIFFADDNLVGYGAEAREQVIELCRGMVERRMRKQWFCQAALNFADDEELLRCASSAGCRMVLLGLEAERTDALVGVNKRLNIQRGVASYPEAIRRIHRAGIAVLGTFIFGFDQDTPELLQRRAGYMQQSDIDVMQMTCLTPLPGTRVFWRLAVEGRLLHCDYPADWDRFDTREVLYQPLGMQPEELAQAMDACTQRVYARPALMRKVLRTLATTHSPAAAMLAWRSNAGQRRGGLLS